jgi:hypothetical protein
MLENAFISAGCHQRNDDLSPDRVVIRRSLPHAGGWPDLWGLTAAILQAGYSVNPIVILRDWNATVQSVLRRDDTRTVEAIENNMRHALREIGSLIDPIYVTYEAFCLQPGFRKWLFVERFGLAEPDIKIKYANPKYYGGET